MTSSTLVSHLLSGSQPHECLLDIADMMDKEDAIGDDWRKLWTDLVNRPLNEAVAQHRPERPTIYTLKLWVRSGKRSEATVGRLIKALSAVYRNDAAERLEEYVQVGMLCYFFFFCMYVYDYFKYRSAAMVQVQIMVSSGHLCCMKI